MRAFIAIEPPVEVIRAIFEVKRQIDAGEQGVSWVREPNAHLTLNFLGEINDGDVSTITKILREASVETTPFTLKTNDIGAFPDLSRPRAIWLGIGASKELSALHKKINDGLALIGHKAEGSAYSPHLTLCRIKDAKSGALIGRKISSNKYIADISGIEFKVTSFFLYRSVLKPTGAQYSKIAQIDLI